MLEESKIHLGIVGRHIDAAMAQDEANLVERDSVPQHLRCSSVAQQVSTFCLALNTRSLKSVLHHGGNPVARGKWLKRSDTPKKQATGIVDLRPAFQVVKQSVADILG